MRKDERKKLKEMNAYFTWHFINDKIADMEEAWEQLKDQTPPSAMVPEIRIPAYLFLLHAELLILKRFIEEDNLNKEK